MAYKKYKAVVFREFRDKNTKTVCKPGEVIEVAKSRLAEISDYAKDPYLDLSGKADKQAGEPDEGDGESEEGVGAEE